MSLFARGMVRLCYCATLGTLMVADSDTVNEFCRAVCVRDTGRVRSLHVGNSRAGLQLLPAASTANTHFLRHHCTATSPPRYPQLHSDTNAPLHPQTSPPVATGAILFSATPHYQIWRTPTLLPIRYSRSPAASPEVAFTGPHTFHALPHPDPPTAAPEAAVVSVKVVS